MGVKAADKRLKHKTGIVLTLLQNSKDTVSLTDVARAVYGVGKPGVKTKKKCRRLLQYIAEKNSG
ncbi:MAG: hypothetical protein H5U03_06005 [Clostridia bacterium]|nr:hypothetical protein [Clostridia bacterium]